MPLRPRKLRQTQRSPTRTAVHRRPTSARTVAASHQSTWNGASRMTSTSSAVVSANVDIESEPHVVSSARWLVRYPLGTVDAMRAMGTVAAPLLAGFALAVVSILATADHLAYLGELAIGAFTAGAVLFVFCLQFTFSALLYSATPDERIAWTLGNQAEPVHIERAQRVQRLDHRLQGRYLARARITYDLGIVSHLVGLLALIAPRHWWSTRDVAFGIVAVALGVELLWIIGGWVGWRPAWLLPGYRNVQDASRSEVPSAEAGER